MSLLRSYARSAILIALALVLKADPAWGIVVGVNIDVHQDMPGVVANDFHIEGRIESGDPGGGWSQPPVLIQHIDDVFPGFTYTIQPDLTAPEQNWFTFQADWSGASVNYCDVLHLGLFFDVTCHNIIIDLVGWWTIDGNPAGSGTNAGDVPVIGFSVDEQILPQIMTLQNASQRGPSLGIDGKIVGMDVIALTREALQDLGPNPLAELRVGGAQETLPWVPVWQGGEPVSELNYIDFPAESFFDVVMEPGLGPIHPEVAVLIPQGGFLLARELMSFTANDGATEFRWFFEIHGAHEPPPPPPPPPPGLVVGINVDIHQDIQIIPWPNDFHMEGRIESSTFPNVVDVIHDVFPFWDIQIGPDVEEGWYTFTADFWGADIPFCTTLHLGVFFEVSCHNIIIDVSGWWTRDGVPIGDGGGGPGGGGRPVPIPGFDVQDRINMPPDPLGQTFTLQNRSLVDTEILQWELVAMTGEELLDPAIGLGEAPFRELRMGGLESQLPWVPVVWPDGEPISDLRPLKFNVDSFFDVFFEIPQEGGFGVLAPFPIPPSGFLVARELLRYESLEGLVEYHWVWEIHGAHELTPELGDAPDSTNNAGVSMTAYPPGGPPGIQANFPTVFGTGSPPHGPLHHFPRNVAWLGNWVTLEQEADIGFDEDPTNNIQPPPDQPDLDLADDGVAIPLTLPHCVPTTFNYVVNVVTPNVPLYVNVWADWNRDGDWDDTLSCPLGAGPADEWAVQNQLLNFAAPGTYNITTPAFVPWHPPFLIQPPPVWLRITLAEQPWSAPGGGAIGEGGSGPSSGYQYGETEDYYFTPELPQVFDKWSQPPTVGGVSDDFYGWDEPSVVGGEQIVADDWPCLDDRPITDIHWWGSYVGWTEAGPPDPAPDAFHIGIWTDVPAGVDRDWSHPGVLLREWVVPRADLAESFVGFDNHPDHGRDSCFEYTFLIPQAEWFFQEPANTNVYWLSIAAVYPPCVCDADADGDGLLTITDIVRVISCIGLPPTGTCAKADVDCDGVVHISDVYSAVCIYKGLPAAQCCPDDGPIFAPYRWGWKTRLPHWHDDAVRVFDPTAPPIGSEFLDGKPIETSEGSWDMAFRLTTTFPPAAQACCLGDGSCLDVLPADCIQIHSGIPQGTGSTCAAAICPAPEACCFNDGSCLDLAAPVCRERGGSPQGLFTNCGVVNICTPTEACCFPNGSCQDLISGACLSNHGVPQGPGSSCQAVICQATEACCLPNGTCTDDTPPQCALLGGLAQGVGSTCANLTCGAPEACCLPPGTCADLPHDFCVVNGGDPQGPGTDCASGVVACHPIKWAQPPVYRRTSPTAECFYGWNDYSVYDSDVLWLVADDFLCDTDAPITNIHWWGSYINWLGQQPPTNGPAQFHIAIWTDVPVAAGNPFSHPGQVIWQWMVDRTASGERVVGCDDCEGCRRDTCFRYGFDIPEAAWFYQGPQSAVYWISISAVYPPTSLGHDWGWKSRPRYYNDDAVRITSPRDPILGSVYANGIPVEFPVNVSWDMAFVLTTAPTVSYDFGDAPQPYPTLLADGGAQHTIVPGIFMGAAIDGEPDGQPEAGALGDDNNNLDDEDGVVFVTPIVPGSSMTIDVTVSVAGHVGFWIDWDGDGNWSGANDFLGHRPVSPGPNSLHFPVSSTAVPGTKFARIRYSTLAGLGVGGAAPDGEVEDYRVIVEEPTPPTYKWYQPPAPAESVFYGWNEPSACCGTMAADDWLCQSEDVLAGVRWWGSFAGWTGTEPPISLADHFHLNVWTDESADPDENCCQCWNDDGTSACDEGPFDEPTCLQMGQQGGWQHCEWHPSASCQPDNTCAGSFSHPGVVVHEVQTLGYTWQFAGWDYDPRTGEYESAFVFEYLFDESEYFHQQPGNIYWLSIGFCGEPGPYPWGWKTVPRDPASPAPDDAVVMPNPNGLCTFPGTTWEQIGGGYPIFWPTPQDSWDLAFELIGRAALSSIKWEQLPNPQWPGVHAHDSGTGPTYQTITLADDFRCLGGAIHDLHWYGNYELDALNNERRGSGIASFHLSLHASAPGLPWSLPGTVLWSTDVPFAAVGENETGLVNLEGSPIYRYSYYLPQPYPQEEGVVYWFDIAALSKEPTDPPLWRWQEAAHGTPPILSPAAEQTGPVPSAWQSIIWLADPELYTDLAFEITSIIYGELTVKWIQPPRPYTPSTIFNGWDEVSMYGGPQIAADDWFCDTGDPVTDVHWWGSYVGWTGEQPPHLPRAFHLGIWTDVPLGADPNANFSHPGLLIHEYVCQNYWWEFAGWDADPRDPTVPLEATFQYRCDLPPSAWFRQEPGGNIYWISIAAIYDLSPSQHPWGWKTRPRDAASAAPDDAVVIYDPTAPALLPVPKQYVAGGPLWWPTPADSWDMAFALTTKPCLPVDPPTLPSAGTHALNPKNRALSFIAANPGRQTALRVTLTASSLFPTHVGKQWWVGPPATNCENAGQTTPPPTGCGPAGGIPSRTLQLSRLQCTPHCMDWGSIGEVLHVLDQDIVPGSTYSVEAIDCDCDSQDESNYSSPLPIATSRWGDVARDLADCPPAPPNGIVEITDVVAILDKFKNRSCAIIKTRADLDPWMPEVLIQISDVTRALDAFAAKPYPFPAPVGCP